MKQQNSAHSQLHKIKPDHVNSLLDFGERSRCCRTAGERARQEAGRCLRVRVMVIMKKPKRGTWADPLKYAYANAKKRWVARGQQRHKEGVACFPATPALDLCNAICLNKDSEEKEILCKKAYIDCVGDALGRDVGPGRQKSDATPVSL